MATHEDTSTSKRLVPYAEFEHFCGPQLAGCGFPLELWGVLFDKLRHEIFDAGECLQLARVEEEEELEVNSADDEPASAKSEDAPDETTLGCTANGSPMVVAAMTDLPAKTDVWLIDHAWTFRVREARSALEGNSALRKRVSGILMGTQGDEQPAAVDAMYQRLWHAASTYRIATEQSLDEECCWYLMDEVGSAVTHVESEEEGNCRLVPLYYPPAQMALSILWLTKDVGEGDTLRFCDALERSRCPGILRCMHALQDGDEDADVEAQLIASFEAYHDALLSVSSEATVTLPRPATVEVPVIPDGLSRPVRVASDLPELVDNIRSVQATRSEAADQSRLITYYFAPELEQADIIWLAEFQELNLNAKYPQALFVSQLGIETTLCHKDAMRRMVRRVYGQVSWLPATYDAATEMHLFAGHYLKQQCDPSSPNLWIVKPHCMARSIDMTVTDCLPLLLRQGETGPKIICQYIAHPCLFRGRKFDLRLIVAVQSLYPVPVVYLYDKVWPRFALEPYSLDNFDVYEKHWTVMNYANPEKMINLRNDDFAKEFDELHGDGAWSQSLERIKDMIVKIFHAVTVDTAPRAESNKNAEGGVGRSATIYGLDVMLTADLQPMLLECTFAPDCHRACVQYPTFFADVFATLFEGKPQHFSRLASDIAATSSEAPFFPELTHRHVTPSHAVSVD